MANSIFEKLKNTIIEGATFSAAKAEEAARKGKLHLDILTERRKLAAALENLGKKTVSAIEENNLDSLKENVDCISILGEIKVLQDKITDLTTVHEEVKSE
ncbi:MAG: hypothetical protein OCC49_02625 [Fibrobacterales bacterium]